jgi:polyhydroxyalkanoate synthesis repressor PhaR
MAYVITRHPNRKLYNAQERRYVTLGALQGLVRSGTEISVVDVGTREDLTSIVLAQIILEGERSDRGTLPPAFLHQLIKHGEAWQEFVQQSLTSSLEGVMTSQREADRVFREWGARAGWLPTLPAERKAERKAETPQDPEALRQEVSSLREQLKALEARLEERRES